VTDLVAGHYYSATLVALPRERHHYSLHAEVVGRGGGTFAGASALVFFDHEITRGEPGEECAAHAGG
jgi:hypothetical protein